MKTKCWVQNGKVIHVGEEWPHCVVTEPVPIEDDPDAVVVATVDLNPIPEGAQLVETELAFSDRGRICLPTDHVTLRGDAYPTIGDQLDALWKGGKAAEAMRMQIVSIKNRFPKP